MSSIGTNANMQIHHFFFAALFYKLLYVHGPSSNAPPLHSPSISQNVVALTIISGQNEYAIFNTFIKHTNAFLATVFIALLAELIIECQIALATLLKLPLVLPRHTLC